MKDMGVVRGSAAQAKPVVIGKDTVYVHTDIKKLVKDEEGNIIERIDVETADDESAEYEYKEIQYTLEEYQELKDSGKISGEEYFTN